MSQTTILFRFRKDLDQPYVQLRGISTAAALVDLLLTKAQVHRLARAIAGDEEANPNDLQPWRKL